MNIVVEWRDVVGFENYYQVSDDGQVRSKDRIRSNGHGDYFQAGKVRQPNLVQGATNNTTYELVHLYVDGKQKVQGIHRLVALAFLPNPDNKPQVNHKDGNGRNNHVSNLEWVTVKENAQHAWRTGLAQPKLGEKAGRSKLKDSDIPVILSRLSAGERRARIAESYGVAPSIISQIASNKIWKHIPRGDYVPEKNYIGRPYCRSKRGQVAPPDSAQDGVHS